MITSFELDSLLESCEEAPCSSFFADFFSNNPLRASRALDFIILPMFLELGMIIPIRDFIKLRNSGFSSVPAISNSRFNGLVLFKSSQIMGTEANLDEDSTPGLGISA